MLAVGGRGGQRWAAAFVASFLFCVGGEPGVKGTLTRNPIFPLYDAPAIKAATLATISIIRSFTVARQHWCLPLLVSLWLLQ